MRHLTLTLCLLTLSCGLGVPDTPVPRPGIKADSPQAPQQTEPTAGTRLVPLYFVGSDGTRWAGGWFYDRELAQNCGLVPLGGYLYCVGTGEKPDPTKHVRFDLRP